MFKTYKTISSLHFRSLEFEVVFEIIDLGICESATCGDLFLLTPSTSKELGWAEKEENMRNLAVLHRELTTFNNCLIVQSER